MFQCFNRVYVNVHGRIGNGDFKYYVEPNSDLGAHNMAEFEHSLNRSKSRLGMLCMGNLSVHIYDVQIKRMHLT